MTHSRTSSKPTETIGDFKVKWYRFINIWSERKLQSFFENQSYLWNWWSQDDNWKLIHNIFRIWKEKKSQSCVHHSALYSPPLHYYFIYQWKPFILLFLFWGLFFGLYFLGGDREQAVKGGRQRVGEDMQHRAAGRNRAQAATGEAYPGWAPSQWEPLKATTPMPHLVGRTVPPEARSFPWSCSGGRVPSHYASGLLKTDVEIRRSQVVQGTRMGASEGYACTLERIGNIIRCII